MKNKKKKKKRGPKLKINQVNFKKALPGSAGLYSLIAKNLKVSRETVVNFLKRQKTNDMMNLIQQEKETILDMAENKLMLLVKEKNMPAIKWFLATQGKSRGYVEKQEIEHMNISDINISFAKPSKKKVKQ